MKKQEMAFPSEALGQTGMTLRDWFAGMALSGLVSDCALTAKWEKFAQVAYVIADKMIEERNK
jgi:hypothetical protein